MKNKDYINKTNAIINIFMGYKYIENCIQAMDLYVCGDEMGEDEHDNIWVLNPSEKFLELKRIGLHVDEDYYNNEEPYDEWHYDNGLKYNEDYNLLMKVIDKLEKFIDDPNYDYYVNTYILNKTDVGIYVRYKQTNYILYESLGLYKNAKDKKEAIYLCVVDFINWFNLKK